MAFRAHVVPVLRRPGPVQHIAMIDALVRIEVEPALASLRLRPGVPRDAERLQPPVRELDQVLLQRLDAEGVRDAEIGELAVGTIRAYEIVAVAPEELRLDTVLAERRVFEVAAHAAFGR